SVVATASDDVGVTTFRYRVGTGSFITVPGSAMSTSVATSAVSVETLQTVDVEAVDGAGNVTRVTRTIKIEPNLPPVVTVSQPVSGARITASTPFAVSGTVTDDSGTPTVTVVYRGVTMPATLT